MNLRPHRSLLSSVCSKTSLSILFRLPPRPETSVWRWGWSQNSSEMRLFFRRRGFLQRVLKSVRTLKKRLMLSLSSARLNRPSTRRLHS
jgi:hypothetical protein